MDKKCASIPKTECPASGPKREVPPEPVTACYPPPPTSPTFSCPAPAPTPAAAPRTTYGCCPTPTPPAATSGSCGCGASAATVAAAPVVDDNCNRPKGPDPEFCAAGANVDSSCGEDGPGKSTKVTANVCASCPSCVEYPPKDDVCGGGGSTKAKKDEAFCAASAATDPYEVKPLAMKREDGSCNCGPKC